jgi:hypothetical protein
MHPGTAVALLRAGIARVRQSVPLPGAGIGFRYGSGRIG